MILEQHFQAQLPSLKELGTSNQCCWCSDTARCDTHTSWVPTCSISHCCFCSQEDQFLGSYTPLSPTLRTCTLTTLHIFKSRLLQLQSLESDYILGGKKSWKGYTNTGAGFQWGCGLFTLGDAQQLSRQGSKRLIHTSSALSRQLDQKTSRILSSLN